MHVKCETHRERHKQASGIAFTILLLQEQGVCCTLAYNFMLLNGHKRKIIITVGCLHFAIPGC